MPDCYKKRVLKSSNISYVPKKISHRYLFGKRRYRWGHLWVRRLESSLVPTKTTTWCWFVDAWKIVRLLRRKTFFCQMSFPVRFSSSKDTQKPIIASSPEVAPRLESCIFEISWGKKKETMWTAKFSRGNREFHRGIQSERPLRCPQRKTQRERGEENCTNLQTKRWVRQTKRRV